ncbi:leucyl aminopeptidase, partial [Corynebacterium diphtheriae]
MKLTINTSFQENASSQYLLILVDSEQLQQSAATYQINKFEEITTATQYKAGLNETLALVGNVPASTNACLVGLGKTAELQPGKLAKVAQTIVKAAQKKFQQISVDISALPVQFHNIFALLLTQAAYAFDEFKSKKNEFVLEQINLIATDSPVTAEQLQLLQAVQTGQNLARDLGNRPGNICFPEYLAEQALALAAEYPELLKVNVLDEQQMADLGMHSFLAVSKGSDRPGRIITIEY